MTKIIYEPKKKMIAGKSKTMHYIGGNPEARKQLKSLQKVYKKTSAPKDSIIVQKGLPKKQREETIKHEEEESAAIKYKHEKYAKAHRRAERDEVLPMSKVKAKISKMRKSK
jgi:hypothetical protein